MADGSFLVLPYDHLGFVKFEPQKDGDLVHVFLSTHDIEIRGMNLRELGLAFQKCAVDWVRALPARSSPRADDDYVWIKSIAVHEAQKPRNAIITMRPSNRHATLFASANRKSRRID